ncbi:unnamed protein product [Didymodactylos carnosus]|uniref:Uncharacterized protein n=1 Tax=Didymodactylos carnosus TaxID=1234261 RepID=A0A814C8R0_9BILA|nr:unnamed protein product [Didymodactylos carnosus]CAF1241625.1 unnamed protein product [Didymodactylos carnosus]CAF3714494.1 unnamed protein product [Didymodactylos carnosus]CAF4049195.1 unnamed protein product [Didymodactylos carnosus]
MLTSIIPNLFTTGKHLLRLFRSQGVGPNTGVQPLSGDVYPPQANADDELYGPLRGYYNHNRNRGENTKKIQNKRSGFNSKIVIVFLLLISGGSLVAFYYLKRHIKTASRNDNDTEEESGGNQARTSVSTIDESSQKIVMPLIHSTTSTNPLSPMLTKTPVKISVQSLEVHTPKPKKNFQHFVW